MELKVIYKNARCAVIEIADGGRYHTASSWTIFLNQKEVAKTDKTITSLYHLTPDTQYEVEAVNEHGERIMFYFSTDYEFVTLNVRDFGAKGDGESDDTLFIQAAVMACPKQSRVLIPAGTYRITSLFLRDDVSIELDEGAVLSAFTDRSRFPVFEGMVQSYDEKGEYNLGTWEGNPLRMFTAIITGVNVKNVTIYGQGTIEGNANKENWWKDPKLMNGAFRPRMVFLERCENVVLQGITVQNSPSWNLHPYFSDNLRFLDMKVLNPKDSPNTDGLDPESCKNVEITGVYFSLGDDCIAIKSGKIYMGATYKRPCENITIRQCCMRDGHGSITIGSEMAGGVKNLTVRDCMFLHTDRGLRIKTRRGRGKDAVIQGILFENITMDHVMTPFVINCFYFCDPDGHSEYVRSKEAGPVDDRLPEISTLTFRNIEATNCHVAAAYMYGLPEKKIGRVEMENVRVTYAENPMCGQPAMMEGCSRTTCRQGIYANNIEELVLKNVEVSGQEGPAVVTENIGNM